jgi:phytanoyl-CoA hydroxylase
MLSSEQIEEYKRVGALVVSNVVSQEEVQALRRVTDEFVEKAQAVTHHDDIYDLEDGHTATSPRVRRIKFPERHHSVYRDLVRHKGIVGVLKDLIGPNLRFDVGKLNMKDAGGGAPVEWHQDWAFYPHTNDDLAAVGVMMDDMELANGPLMIIPGSHKGPIFDHHSDNNFCGAMDPRRRDVDYSKALALTGSAGSITIHHVRTVHGSGPNISNRQRRLLLLQYRAADAWPLLGTPTGLPAASAGASFQLQSWEAYEELMVAGVSSNEPRLEAVPVRLPFPGGVHGTIYEMQKASKRSYWQ